MITVFKVSSCAFLPTRLHLACSVWGEEVRAALIRKGFSVEPTDQAHEADDRGPAELARVDALLTITGL